MIFLGDHGDNQVIRNGIKVVRLGRGIDGKAFVEFVINNDGKISDAGARKGIALGYDEEALRAVVTQRCRGGGAAEWKEVKARMILPPLFKMDE